MQKIKSWLQLHRCKSSRHSLEYASWSAVCFPSKTLSLLSNLSTGRVCNVFPFTKSNRHWCALTDLSYLSDILAVDLDTTLFSLANANYQVVVQFLLQATTSTGLTEANLIAFKTQFGGTAFVCPVKGCVKGFPSETGLNDHKAQRHKRRLRCYQGKCIHNDVGFANTGSLHQHVRKVHKKETPRIPTALKRKNVEDYEPPVPCHSYTVDGHPSNALTPLADLDLERLSLEHKRAVDDWFVVFNPHVPRLVDLDLVHTLAHDSVACCVSFSKDGKYVATGCNRFAHIWDFVTGDKIVVLGFEDDGYGGDMYIRSVSFSPDGKYLATGSEDKLVRVRTRAVTTPAASLLTSARSGTSKPAPSGTPLLDMSRMSTV